jgi:hypothetical protein
MRPEDLMWIEGQTKLPAPRAKEVARNSTYRAAIQNQSELPWSGSSA